MKIENILRRGRTITVAGKSVTFDSAGFAEVDDATGAILQKLGGYRAVSQPVSQPKSAPKTAQPAEEAKHDDLETLSVAQLKKLAKDKGIDTGDATKKADLIALVAARG